MKRRIYITGMSKDLKTMRDYLWRTSGQIVIHLMKLCMYPDNLSCSHWISEIWTFLNHVDKLKGKNKFPDKDFILKCIWSDIDYNDIVGWQRGLIKEYGPGQQLDIINVYDKCDDYMHWLSDNLSSSGYVSKSHVYHKLHELGL